jgi:hypothetical protein
MNEKKMKIFFKFLLFFWGKGSPEPASFFIRSQEIKDRVFV